LALVDTGGYGVGGAEIRRLWVQSGLAWNSMKRIGRVEGAVRRRRRRRARRSRELPHGRVVLLAPRHVLLVLLGGSLHAKAAICRRRNRAAIRRRPPYAGVPTYSIREKH